MKMLLSTVILFTYYGYEFTFLLFDSFLIIEPVFFDKRKYLISYDTVHPLIIDFSFLIRCEIAVSYFKTFSKRAFITYGFV